LAAVGLRGRPTYDILAGLGLSLGDAPGPKTVTKLELRDLLRQVDAEHVVAASDALAARQRVEPLADDHAVIDWLLTIRPELEATARARLAELLRRWMVDRPTGEAASVS
jgi:hypothetical protein